MLSVYYSADLIDIDAKNTTVPYHILMNVCEFRSMVLMRSHADDNRAALEVFWLQMKENCVSQGTVGLQALIAVVMGGCSSKIFYSLC